MISKNPTIHTATHTKAIPDRENRDNQEHETGVHTPQESASTSNHNTKIANKNTPEDIFHHFHKHKDLPSPPEVGTDTGKKRGHRSNINSP